MYKSIIIVVDYLNFLRNDLYRSSSLNLSTIQAILDNEGYEVQIYTFQELILANNKPKDKIIWYASSDFPSYKNYIEDILHTLKEHNLIVPPFDLFRAHDNKGYQSLMRAKIDLPQLKEYYFGTLEELLSLIDNIEFPMVLKKPGGSGSTNVKLVRNSGELIRIVKKLSRKSSFLFDLIKRYLKRFVFTGKYSNDNSRESLYYGNFILQEFIPDLVNDWKILIFYDKYYVFERETRTNDFRASGSGKFFYRDFDLSMLDFCADIFRKLHTPWASLDVCRGKTSYHLIEFQGINFGPIGLLNAPYYFQKDSSNQWQKIPDKSDLSKEYASAVVKYLKFLSSFP
jgi:glutathione synthase/RimK-type ligase-like ATP-grasp enzyme